MLYRQIIDCEMDRFSDHAMGPSEPVIHQVIYI